MHLVYNAFNFCCSKDEKHQLTLNSSISTQMNFSEDESNQENTKVLPFVNEIIASSQNLIDKIDNDTTSEILAQTKTDCDENDYVLDTLVKKSSLKSTSTIQIRPNLPIKSESTTPCSSTHSTTSTGITVLERNVFNANKATDSRIEFDQDLCLDDFDLCVDEANDGDDELDESLNFEDNCLDEDYNKTPVPSSLTTTTAAATQDADCTCLSENTIITNESSFETRFNLESGQQQKFEG